MKFLRLLVLFCLLGSVAPVYAAYAADTTPLHWAMELYNLDALACEEWHRENPIDETTYSYAKRVPADVQQALMDRLKRETEERKVQNKPFEDRIVALRGPGASADPLGEEFYAAKHDGSWDRMKPAEKEAFVTRLESVKRSADSWDQLLERYQTQINKREAEISASVLDEKRRALSRDNARFNACVAQYYEARSKEDGSWGPRAYNDATRARYLAMFGDLHEGTYDRLDASVKECEREIGSQVYRDPINSLKAKTLEMGSVQTSFLGMGGEDHAGPGRIEKRVQERFAVLAPSCKDDGERLDLALALTAAISKELEEDRTVLDQPLAQPEPLDVVIQKSIKGMPKALQRLFARETAKPGADKKVAVARLVAASAQLNEALYQGGEAARERLEGDFSSIDALAKWVQHTANPQSLEEAYQKMLKEAAAWSPAEQRFFGVGAPNDGMAGYHYVSNAEKEGVLERFEVVKERREKMAPLVASVPGACAEVVFSASEVVIARPVGSQYMGDPEDYAAIDAFYAEQARVLEAAEAAYEKSKDAWVASQLEKVSKAVSKLSMDDKRKLEARAQEVAKKEREHSPTELLFADPAEIFEASDETFVSWTARSEDIATLFRAVDEVAAKERGADRPVQADIMELHHKLDAYIRSAEGRSAKPEERSVKIAQMVKEVAEKHNIKVEVPQWLKEAPSASASGSLRSSFVGQNPLLVGTGVGVTLFAASVVKAIRDYNQNQPVDENGNVVPLKEYVLRELKNFNPKTASGALKWAALAAVGAGLYVKVKATA